MTRNRIRIVSYDSWTKLNYDSWKHNSISLEDNRLSKSNKYTFNKTEQTYVCIMIEFFIHFRIGKWQQRVGEKMIWLWRPLFGKINVFHEIRPSDVQSLVVSAYVHILHMYRICRKKYILIIQSFQKKDKSDYFSENVIVYVSYFKNYIFNFQNWAKAQFWNI